MTLDEAIEHCKDVAKNTCTECSQEHLQLAMWLKELKGYKQMIRDAVDGKVVARFPLASEPRYVDAEIFVKYAQNLNEGDKVKMIIIKEG